MCTKTAILKMLADYGPCDVHMLQRWIHADGHSVTFMATQLIELVNEGQVAVAIGYYAIPAAGGGFPVVPLPAREA